LYDDGRRVPLLVAQPTSPSRVAWHVFGFIFILYDVFKLPIDHAFRPDETDFSKVIDWITLMYWTLNILASLTEGYSEHGEWVFSLRKIFLRYMKTWFPLDALILVPDWTFAIWHLSLLGKSANSTAFTRFLNVSRLVRIVRLLRLLKLRKMLDMLNDMTDSEHTNILLNVVAQIVTLLIISHQIGCAWYAIGASRDSNTASWTVNRKLAGTDDWVYMYVTALHWTVCQFTPASVEVHPENIGERVFAIIVVIFALLGFAYILGSISCSLAQLRVMRAEESKLFWDLRRYLVRNKVSKKLSSRIKTNLEYAWRFQQERKSAQSVQLMSLLSEQLLSELQCELAITHLRIHPFLARLCQRSEATAQRLASSAICHKLVARGDYLFHPGEEATHFWIVVEGTSEYTKRDSSGILIREKVKNDDDWIAEPILWTTWVHRGLLTSLEDGDVLAVDATKFGSVVRHNPTAHTFASAYAHNFVKWLNDLHVDELTDISQGEDVSLVESFMCFDTRKSGGRPSESPRGSICSVNLVGARVDGNDDASLDQTLRGS
jgi:CRP-like cAMP-binding protein